MRSALSSHKRQIYSHFISKYPSSLCKRVQETKKNNNSQQKSEMENKTKQKEENQFKLRMQKKWSLLLSRRMCQVTKARKKEVSEKKHTSKTGSELSNSINHCLISVLAAITQKLSVSKSQCGNVVLTSKVKDRERKTSRKFMHITSIEHEFKSQSGDNYEMNRS